MIRNATRLGLTLGLIDLIGCKGRSGTATATLDPNSGYAKRRPAMVKARFLPTPVLCLAARRDSAASPA